MNRIRSVDDLGVKLFADGADKASMLELYAQPWIKGFTTNPTLMRKAGIEDYETFAREILDIHSGLAHFARGIRGRVSRDGSPGAPDCILG